MAGVDRFGGSGGFGSRGVLGSRAGAVDGIEALCDNLWPMAKTPTVVVIDDETGSRESMAIALEKAGWTVSTFDDAAKALTFIEETPSVTLAICDLRMPGMDGLGFLEATAERNLDLRVILVTGYGSIESAVEAMRVGADDYLTKPVDLFELRKRTSAIVEKRRLTRRVDELESRLGERFKIVGNSKSMQDLFRQLELVAPARANVLIISESGTGKELVANALHENSPRRNKRFLPINCAAIPSEILESELFGHERGAFTGATARKPGKFEVADGGTVFLDEIGELPVEMQAKLLRVLEQQEFMRVGGTTTIRVDIRVIAATNSDLEAAVEAGRFRSDLFYRLKVVTVRIPPLRERTEDIPVLLKHFLDLYGAEYEREGLHFSSEALRRLIRAPWEGNVRELRNLVESLTVLAPQAEVRVEDLPEEYQHPVRRDAAAAEPVPDGPERADEDLTMEEIERRAILNALQKTEGNRTRAASLLGIGLRTLQRKLKEYRLAGKD
jgi:DNA-binding NtrC family response regulator